MSVIADTHVHIYPSYNIKLLFQCAFKNLTALDNENGPIALVLCLTESVPYDFFSKLTSEESLLAPLFGVQRTDEETSLCISHNDKSLFVISGRQVKTNEGLEVHALKTTANFKDNLSLIESIDAIISAGAEVVIPWSPGKWFFKRGEIIKKALDRFGPKVISLGDSRLRPSFWETPAMIQKASARGYRILGGSDPLPLPNEETRIGSYGIRLEGNINKSKPGASFISLLREAKISLLGKRCDSFHFLRSQMALRIKKLHNA